MVGPSAWASRTRSAHPERGPASRLTWTDAVEVIIAAPAVPVRLARKNVSMAAYLAPGFTRPDGRSGSAPSNTIPKPARVNAARSTARSEAMAAAASGAAASGGPDNSTAPPGSTVTRLPPGSGSSAAIVAVSSSQPGRRSGSFRSKQCASISSPTGPTGPSVRQLSAMRAAASSALVKVSQQCSATPSDAMVRAISRPLRIEMIAVSVPIFQSGPTKSRDLIGDGGMTGPRTHCPSVFCMAPASTLTAGPPFPD